MFKIKPVKLKKSISWKSKRKVDWSWKGVKEEEWIFFLLIPWRDHQGQVEECLIIGSWWLVWFWTRNNSVDAGSVPHAFKCLCIFSFSQWTVMARTKISLRPQTATMKWSSSSRSLFPVHRVFGQEFQKRAPKWVQSAGPNSIACSQTMKSIVLRHQNVKVLIDCLYFEN